MHAELVDRVQGADALQPLWDIFLIQLARQIGQFTALTSHLVIKRGRFRDLFCHSFPW